MLNKEQKSIYPPQTIGIIGGGQLGRMLAISTRQMGYKVVVLEPDVNAPAKYFANEHIIANYTDKLALTKLAELSDVITTEFENVPAEAIEFLDKLKPVYPKANAILISQNRLKEKTFFNSLNIKTTQYYPIINIDDINNIDDSIFPAILKTTTMGYDGKGQIKVINKLELSDAFNKLNNCECILEKMLELNTEVSVIIARNNFETVAYPVIENIHKNGILDISIIPARVDNEIIATAKGYAEAIVTKLDYIGVLTIEFFISNDGEVYANEMAPRPHNSGHYSIDASLTSQFEQQLRSVCNLKLGDTSSHSCAVMMNILGNIYHIDNDLSPPNWGIILNKYANIKLHLYEKEQARTGRKMGHLTLLGNDLDNLITQAHEIKQLWEKR